MADENTSLGWTTSDILLFAIYYADIDRVTANIERLTRALQYAVNDPILRDTYDCSLDHRSVAAACMNVRSAGMYRVSGSMYHIRREDIANTIKSSFEKLSQQTRSDLRLIARRFKEDLCS